jgi:hypothetical protein
MKENRELSAQWLPFAYSFDLSKEAVAELRKLGVSLPKEVELCALVKPPKTPY